MNRTQTRQVKIGKVPLGGGAPVTVQSMCNTKTRDVPGTLEQIKRLYAAGCEIVRVTVPDMESADALADICRESPLPVVADIHFDYRLAIASVEAGAAKIRINPGNIGGEDRVRAVAEARRAFRSVSASIPEALKSRCWKNTAIPPPKRWLRALKDISRCWKRRASGTFAFR